MPKLYRPLGKDVVNVLPVTPGAVPSVGLFTAELIDLDYTTNLDSSVTAVQYARAVAMLIAADLDPDDLIQEKWSQAKRALYLACYSQYLELDRVKRLNALQKCEDDEQFKEKMGGVYKLVCNAWKVLGITDDFFCNTGFEGSPSVILEGKTKETPNDLVSLY